MGGWREAAAFGGEEVVRIIIKEEEEGELGEMKIEEGESNEKKARVVKLEGGRSSVSSRACLLSETDKLITLVG